MKRSIKKLFYLFFKGLSKLNTDGLSHFLISTGYMLKSERQFNRNSAKTLGWDRLDFHKYFVTEYFKPNEEIVYLEFGVFKGQAFRIYAENNTNPNSYFAGFDTFEGLPEDWGTVAKGTFNAKGRVPDIPDSRVHFFVGLIQDTLPGFLKTLEEHTGKRKIIHIDVDLYNATLITLVLLNPYINKGDIIIFDDYYSFTVADHEFKAHLDYNSLYNRKQQPLFNVNHSHYVMEIE